MIFCHFLVFFVFPSPHYPAYEMQQREFVNAFAVDNQHYTFVGECLQLKGIILGNEGYAAFFSGLHPFF